MAADPTSLGDEATDAILRLLNEFRVLRAPAVFVRRYRELARHNDRLVALELAARAVVESWR